MKRSGSIFPDRIDSFSQLPLLPENNVHSIAFNSLRSAVIKIEETIGEGILNSRFYNKFLSIKERIDLIENLSHKIPLPDSPLYREYMVLHLSDSGWVERDINLEPKQLGVVVGGSIITDGSIWMENKPDIEVGKKINIIDEKIVHSNDLLYIGTIVAKRSNLAQILLRNTWIA
jgi:hypothetical protein